MARMFPSGQIVFKIMIFNGSGTSQGLALTGHPCAQASSPRHGPQYSSPCTRSLVNVPPPPWLHLLQSILYPFLMGLFCDPEMLMLFACLRPLPGSALFSGQTPDSPMCLPRVLQLQPLARGTPGSSHPGLRWREAVQCSG